MNGRVRLVNELRYFPETRRLMLLWEREGYDMHTFKVYPALRPAVFFVKRYSRNYLSRSYSHIFTSVVAAHQFSSKSTLCKLNVGKFSYSKPFRCGLFHNGTSCDNKRDAEFPPPKRSFSKRAPEEELDKPIGSWLVFSAGLVFCMVLLGGITRLTESGLSMVDWSLLHYKAPTNEAEWEAYFEKYKASPEYILYGLHAYELSMDYSLCCVFS